MLSLCPVCGTNKDIREVIYRLPAESVYESKFAIGVCCISDNDLTIKCIDCGCRGEYVDNVQLNKEKMKVVQLPDISKISDIEIQSYPELSGIN